nr:hypothetical protein [Tanacetum cinerariifolium]
MKCCLKQKKKQGRKTKAFDSKEKKSRNNASENEDDTAKEELKMTRKMKKDGAEEDTKPRKKVTCLTCNTRSSPKALFDAMKQRDANDPFIAEWEAQYSHLKKPTPPAIAFQISSTTEEDFMFKKNFITLFGSTKETLENGGRVPKKLLKCIKEEDDIAELDWCGYIMDCLRNSKVNWKDVKNKNNFYYRPLTFLCLLYLDSTFFLDLNIIRHRPAIRSWNTMIIRKRIKMETRQKCLGSLEHHGDFNSEEEQIGIDLYKGLDVYIEPLSDRIPVTREYRELFNDNEFNVSESSMDDYTDGDSDADDNNKKNDDEKKRWKMETRKNDFENLLGDDTEDEVSMDMDILNEEMKQKEANKEQMSEKNGNESKKEKQYEPDKVEKVQEIQEEHNHFVFETKDGAATIMDYMQTLAPQLKVESNVIDTFSLILNHEHKMNSNENKIKYFFHTTMITKDLFKWKKKNGEYDEEKQFEAFSKTIKSESKKDTETKNKKDLEMAFFPIIAHEHYYLVVFNFLKGNTVIIDNSKTKMTYDAEYKTICELLKKLFSMHLEKVEHTRAKDVLKKSRQSSGLNGEQKRMTQTVEFF